MPDQQKSLTAATAFRFVLILGIANGFADLTYEGARSVTGQFLGYLGASAAVIGSLPDSENYSATRYVLLPVI